MRVTVVDCDEGQLDAVPKSSAVRVITVDLTEIGALSTMLQLVVEGLGPVDAFVPTAAVVRPQTDLFKVTEADWDFHVAINQKAVYFITRDVAEHMKSNGGGAIVW